MAGKKKAAKKSTTRAASKTKKCAPKKRRTKKNQGGRPSLRTAARIDALLQHLRKVPVKVAGCAQAGISTQTLQNWIDGDSVNRRIPADKKLAAKVEQAMEAGKAWLVNRAHAGATQDPRLAFQMAVRMGIEELQGVQKVELTGKDGGPLQVPVASIQYSVSPESALRPACNCAIRICDGLIRWPGRKFAKRNSQKSLIVF